MPNTSTPWTRRQFSQLLAASAASIFLGQRALPATQGGHSHIASAAKGGAIHTFRISGSQWHKVQSLASPNPAHLESHPTLPILYALHNVPLWQNLPRGAVSAYAIAPNGHLTLLHTQPLSLAATNPRHAAIASDGTAIAVAAAASGIFNILPIALDGTLQPPAIIRKHLNPNTAAIHSLSFLPDGKTLLTANSRNHALHAFKIEADLLISIPLNPTTTIPIPTNLVLRPA